MDWDKWEEAQYEESKAMRNFFIGILVMAITTIAAGGILMLLLTWH